MAERLWKGRRRNVHIHSHMYVGKAAFAVFKVHVYVCTRFMSECMNECGRIYSSHLSRMPPLLLPPKLIVVSRAQTRWRRNCFEPFFAPSASSPISVLQATYTTFGVYKIQALMMKSYLPLPPSVKSESLIKSAYCTHYIQSMYA